MLYIYFWKDKISEILGLILPIFHDKSNFIVYEAFRNLKTCANEKNTDTKITIVHLIFSILNSVGFSLFKAPLKLKIYSWN